jgi:single-strand DNA-binding protein
MSSRSLNKVTLIGNLTRDPELRYTPTGAAVCTIGLATNRTWVTDAGEKKEETEFHRVVAWNKLAELCSQLLSKGRKVYVEGRLRTSAWQAQDGSQRTSTEIVIEDMIVLDSKRPGEEAGEPQDKPPAAPVAPKKKVEKKETKEEAPSAPSAAEEVNPDDIPF